MDTCYKCGSEDVEVAFRIIDSDVVYYCCGEDCLDNVPLSSVTILKPNKYEEYMDFIFGDED